MRILGIDFGDKKIGLAVSDPLQLTAQALAHYRLRNENEDRDYFKKLVSEYEIEKIVLGLPLSMDGTSGPRVDRTKTFAQWLNEFLDVPIIYWDERLTTKQAIGILSKQKVKRKVKKSLEDQIAAVIILSSFLEGQRNRSPE